jgi:hypothetical protein
MPQAIDMNDSGLFSIVNLHVDGADHLDNFPPPFPFWIKFSSRRNGQPVMITNLELAMPGMFVVECPLLSS